MRMRPVGNRMFQAGGGRERERDGRRDRQEDMTNLMLAVPDFANGPKVIGRCTPFATEQY